MAADIFFHFDIILKQKLQMKKYVVIPNPKYVLK